MDADNYVTGTGKLGAVLRRMPARDTSLSTPPAKPQRGLAVIEDAFQRNAEATGERRVRVIDHDDGDRTLFTGTPEQWKRLQKAVTQAAKKRKRNA